MREEQVQRAWASIHQISEPILHPSLKGLGYPRSLRRLSINLPQAEDSWPLIPYFVLRPMGPSAVGVVYLGPPIQGPRALFPYAGVVRRKAKKEAQAPKHCYDLSPRYCVDATEQGNIARFVGHSCAPNCVAVPHCYGYDQVGVAFVLLPGHWLRPGVEVVINSGRAADERENERCACTAKVCTAHYWPPTPQPKLTLHEEKRAFSVKAPPLDLATQQAQSDLQMAHFEAAIARTQDMLRTLEARLALVQNLVPPTSNDHSSLANHTSLSPTSQAAKPKETEQEPSQPAPPSQPLPNSGSAASTHHAGKPATAGASSPPSNPSRPTPKQPTQPAPPEQQRQHQEEEDDVEVVEEVPLVRRRLAKRRRLQRLSLPVQRQHQEEEDDVEVVDEVPLVRRRLAKRRRLQRLSLPSARPEVIIIDD
jgi:hypothetical protein